MRVQVSVHLKVHLFSSAKISVLLKYRVVVFYGEASFGPSKREPVKHLALVYDLDLIKLSSSFQPRSSREDPVSGHQRREEAEKVRIQELRHPPGQQLRPREASLLRRLHPGEPCRSLPGVETVY